MGVSERIAGAEMLRSRGVFERENGELFWSRERVGQLVLGNRGV